jgi:hypothetical protein
VRKDSSESYRYIKIPQHGGFRIGIVVLMVCLASACSGKSPSQPQANVSDETNNVPTESAVSIRIAPEDATSRMNLAAVIERGDSESKATFRWVRNGQIVEGSNTDYLLGVSVRKGDVISVEVDVTDRQGNTTHAKSAPVTIQDAPPRFTEMPEIISNGDAFEVRAEATDDDGDPVTFTYQWLEDGKEIGGETAARLGLSKVTIGKTYTARVTPSDGTIQGESMLAGAVGTRAQRIKVALKPSPLTAVKDITAELSPPRSNGDAPLFFVWSVNDSQVDTGTKDRLDRAEFKKGDKVSLNVFSGPPSDSSRTLLGTSPTVPVANAAPVIEMVQSSRLSEGGRYVNTIVAKDPDGEPVTFTLEQGPGGMTLDPKSGLLEWTPPEGMEKPVHIRLIASDGSGAASRLEFDLRIGGEIKSTQAND